MQEVSPLSNEFLLSKKSSLENNYLEYVTQSEEPLKWYNDIEQKKASQFNPTNILLIITIKNNYSFYYIL